MDKSCHSSGDSSPTAGTGNGTTNSNNNLRQLNKASHKISKASLRNRSASESSLTATEGEAKEKVDEAQNQNLPPVYNINKNDFRDVVQKLTGSPAHDRLSNQQQQPKPPPTSTSRLHRIRPPPLAHISNHPAPSLNGAVPRPQPPFSPLPPFPSVHAESPVSAYMRHLQNSTMDCDPKQLSGFPPLVSTRWNNLAPQQPPPEPQSQVTPVQQAAISSPTSSPAGRLNSPCLLISPSSAQSGFPQLPLSPTVPSPRWRGI